jgi:hypothetical protein
LATRVLPLILVAEGKPQGRLGVQILAARPVLSRLK